MTANGHGRDGHELKSKEAPSISIMDMSDLSARLRDLDHRQYVRYVDERTADARTRLSLLVRQALRPAQIIRQARRLGYALTPQLGRELLWDERPPPAKLYTTSYLTGLRGLLAVKVVTFHYLMAFSDFGFQPWGTDARHTRFLELPIIRLLFAGFTAHLFFGISGYLIAIRMLQALDRQRAGHHSDIFGTISRNLFRKSFRLYLPVFAITFCTAVYIMLGFYESYRPLLLDHEKLFPGDWYEPKPQQHSMLKQAGIWLHEMFDLTNVVTENTVYPFHDQHLWAILAEMRGTLHLYGVLVAVSQCRPHIRLIAMMGISVLYFYWNHWEVWVFILGAMVAQADLMLSTRPRAAANFRPNDDHEFEPAPSAAAAAATHDPVGQWTEYGMSTAKDERFQKGLRYVGFVVALYFLSYPVDGARDYAPGYLWLNWFIPRFMVRKDKFYPNVGTAILLLMLARSNPTTSRWRRLLTSKLPLYLGKISFAIFLVHGPVMHSIGYMMPHKMAWTFGTELQALSEGTWAVVVGFGWTVTLLLTLWAADVWHREVEGRCVDMMETLERVCFEEPRSEA
jgi:peptidoglycan/LPS O-acetylase OafA/YrhL